MSNVGSLLGRYLRREFASIGEISFKCLRKLRSSETQLADHEIINYLQC